MTQPDPVPEALLTSVVRWFDPVRVILFGSHARADVAHDADKQPVILEAHFGDRQLDGKHRAILAQALDMESDRLIADTQDLFRKMR